MKRYCLASTVMTAIVAYNYLRPSTFGARTGLLLQTSGNGYGSSQAHPRFFSGFVTSPEPVALALLAVAEVARTRYYQPTSPASRDPVVTCSRERLRFESFSGCCGVYARVDVTARRPRRRDTSTTAPPMSTSTRRCDRRWPGSADATRSGSQVGADELIVSTIGWCGGRAQGAAAVAMAARVRRGPRHLVGLRSSTRGDRGAEASCVPAPAAGCQRSVGALGPAGRARRCGSPPAPCRARSACPVRAGWATLRPLARLARVFRAYGPAVSPHRDEPHRAHGSWSLANAAGHADPVAGARSRLLGRGCGPGRALAGEDVDRRCRPRERVARLGAHDRRRCTRERQRAFPPVRVQAALTQLGTAGRVGYDVTEAAYFHRVLSLQRRRGGTAEPTARGCPPAGRHRMRCVALRGRVRSRLGNQRTHERYRVRVDRRSGGLLHLSMVGASSWRPRPLQARACGRNGACSNAEQGLAAYGHRGIDVTTDLPASAHRDRRRAIGHGACLYVLIRRLRPARCQGSALGRVLAKENVVGADR